jgi:aminoglycoside/choline kinase family phosphotransferase
VDRKRQLEQWLGSVLTEKAFTLSTVSSDASFRRYFRVHLQGETLITMDAPPEQESCTSFVEVSKLFSDCGLHVPQVIAQDMAQGFLLLSDMGNDTYLSQLTKETAQPLYGDATNALVKLQLASKPNVLPAYDEALLMREMQLFPEWYLAKHLNVDLDDTQKTVLNKVFAILTQNILSQTQVYVHRDYHSRNLMVCEDNPGILDFQDAVYGPITYDLVSLLKDAYIGWEEADMMDWVVRYWDTARKDGLSVPSDFSEFYRDFEWMGAQRQIKVLGIFARLSHRDGKDVYLKDMPLVMDYLRRVCGRYLELRPMLKLLNQIEGQEEKAGYTF